jgi:2'-5' RNA ligase
MPPADDTVRAFLALEIPPQHRKEIADHQHALRERLPRARWVRPEGLHLTLKFLGEVARHRLGALTGDMAPRLAGVGAVAVTFEGCGFFPSARRPRVIWVGGCADGVEPVVEIVEEVAVDHGFDRERRRWSLHLTLARLRDPWPASAVETFQQWGSGLRLEEFVCSEVVLVQSDLGSGGAVYTELERMPLE